jgi:uncharacterized protein YbaA (DUF1428 family)
MKRKININIAKPCQQSWDEMGSDDKRRFCDSCQKHVYDFTKSSDREIVERLNAEPKLCGRFLGSQLNRDLIVPKEKSSFWMAAASGALAFLNIGGHELSAQTQPEMVQTYKHQTLSGKEKKVIGIISDKYGPLPYAKISLKGKTVETTTNIDGEFIIMAEDGDVIIASYTDYKSAKIKIRSDVGYYGLILKPKGNYYQQQQPMTITGIVEDAVGTIPGVNVIIKGTTTGVQTDFDGRFSIQAKPGDILIFSFVGMKDKEVKVRGSKPVIAVKLNEGYVLGGMG